MKARTNMHDVARATYTAWATAVTGWEAVYDAILQGIPEEKVPIALDEALEGLSVTLETQTLAAHLAALLASDTPRVRYHEHQLVTAGVVNHPRWERFVTETCLGIVGHGTDDEGRYVVLPEAIAAFLPEWLDGPKGKTA